MYALIPLGIISTALSSSIQKGNLRRWKVFLVVLAGTIVYVIVHFLMKYMDAQDQDFFQCNLGMQIWGYYYPRSPYNLTVFGRMGFDNAIENELPDPELWMTLGKGTMYILSLLSESYCMLTGGYSVQKRSFSIYSYDCVLRK